MAKYRVRTAPLVSGTPTTPRKWTDLGTFEIADPDAWERISTDPNISDPNISDPNNYCFWVTSLNITRSQDASCFVGTVRYEGDNVPHICTLTPADAPANAPSEAWFEVNVADKPNAIRRWKLRSDIQSLTIQSPDQGFTLTGTMQTVGGIFYEFVAIKYTPEVTLDVGAFQVPSDWKRCKNSNGQPVGHYYQFCGGDDDKGGLIVAKGRTKYLKLNLKSGNYRVKKIRWGEGSSTTSPSWANEIDFSETEDNYISDINNNNSNATATSSYCIGVVEKYDDGEGTELIWCDPVIRNKATGS